MDVIILANLITICDAIDISTNTQEKYLNCGSIGKSLFVLPSELIVVLEKLQKNERDLFFLILWFYEQTQPIQ